MLKRKAETTLTRQGQHPNPQASQLDIGQDETPQQIQKRKIYRARRPIRQPNFNQDNRGRFQLKAPLISSQQQQKVMASKNPVFSFINKPNVLGALVKDLNQKTEAQLIGGFIKSKTPTKQIQKPELLISETPNSSILRRECLIKAKLQVEEQNRGEGFIELSISKHQDSKVMRFGFRNLIKNVIYQGVLSENSVWKQCKDIKIGEEDESDHCEIQIQVYRNIGKVVQETCRVQVRKEDKKELLLALENLKNKSVQQY